MKLSCKFRSLGLTVLALGAVVLARGDSFEEPTYIDFNTRGYTHYDIFIAASVSSYYTFNSIATAEVRFGGTPSSASSIGYNSTAASLRINGIHQLNDNEWIADSVEASDFYYGWPSDRVYFDVVLPSASMAMGEARCEGMVVPLWGTITGWGEPPPNSPPVPWFNAAGVTNGMSIAPFTRLSLEFGASDPDGNLTGVTYNIYNSSTGSHNHFLVTQIAGPSQSIAFQYTLTTPGDWYFWTDAIDLRGATASTPSWTNGFKLVVSPAVLCVPSYQPSYWNSSNAVRLTNNCYNYANNRRTDTFAQPGRGSGTWVNSLLAASLVYRATSDGLAPTTASAGAPSGKTKVALVIWPGQDYHWYRQDSGGRWSHKTGTAPATNLDNSGMQIFDPQLADRGPYTEFVGYFLTPADCVQGQGHANIW